MGYDLRMPAAFKVLQRSRPPENSPEPVGITTIIPDGISTVQKNSFATSADAPIQTDYDQLDFGFSFDDNNNAPRSQETEGEQDPSLDLSSAEAKPREKLAEESSVHHPEAGERSHTNIEPQAVPSEEQVESQLRDYKITETEGDKVRSHGITRGISGATVPQESDFALSGAEAAKLKFAASAPELARQGLDRRVSSGGVPYNHRLLAFSSTTSFSRGVDRYGFKKPSNNISEDAFNDWSNRYTKYMAHREEKWNALLKAHGLNLENRGEIPVRFPPESQRLRRYVRKGIPPKWRGNAWFWFARGHEKLNSRPGLYKKYVDETEGLKNSDTEHIERDLHRTFPDNIYFRNDPVTNEESAHLKSLRRVLKAFSYYQPKIGYCQSLNFIVGNLLLFMDEERAFWMLVIITQNYLAGLHEVNLEQVNISQGILMISVRDRLPKIWNALNLEQSFEDNFISNLPPISLCTAPWFMSLMVNVLPTETMLRVWDCFFLEGPKTLYRIALTIFKLVESQMGKATDELEVFQIIQSAPRKLYDPEVLMKACFKRANGFGHISNEDIALLRSFVQNRRKQALEGVEQTLNDRHAYAKLHRGRRVRAKLSLYR